MNLFGKPKEKPVRPYRHHKRATWLQRKAKGDAGEEIVSNMKKDNPVVQAAIVRELTGINVRPGDIKAKTPEEELEALVTRKAMKDIEKNTDLIEEVKLAVLDRIARSTPAGRRHLHGIDGNGTDDECTRCCERSALHGESTTGYQRSVHDDHGDQPGTKQGMDCKSIGGS